MLIIQIIYFYFTYAKNNKINQILFIISINNIRLVGVVSKGLV